ncbi:MAG: hypothetical protein ABR961_08610 [Thermoanaerobaculaceae bacterium]|jgi:hypothetical protein
MPEETILHAAKAFEFALERIATFKSVTLSSQARSAVGVMLGHLKRQPAIEPPVDEFKNLVETVVADLEEKESQVKAALKTGALTFQPAFGVPAPSAPAIARLRERLGTAFSNYCQALGERPAP